MRPFHSTAAALACCALLLLSTPGVWAQAPAPASTVAETAAKPTLVTAGPLKLEVYTASRTAHLFHVVDQLSLWSEFCHGQYRRHFELSKNGGLSPEEDALLAEHAAIRKRKGWGGGLEQTFYTPQPLDAALLAGVKAKYLTPAEAATERRVLQHFAPRIEQLMQNESGAAQAFAARIVERRADLEAFAKQAGRLFGTTALRVPVFLFANPDARSMGGGYNGERMTLEIPPSGGSDAFPMFLHEIFHAFVNTRAEAMEQAVRGVEGLDAMTLNEGLAYALSPGLLHTGSSESDPLQAEVVSDMTARKTLADNYAKFRRYGLAVRPLVKEALANRAGTIEELLPRAVAAWRALRELSLALDSSGGRASVVGQERPRPRVYSFGPAWEALNSVANARGCYLAAYNYSPEYFQQSIAQAAPGTPVVLLYALDSKDRKLTDEFRRLLPQPLNEVEAQLRKGSTVEAASDAGGFKVVLLAAPSTARLADLIASTKLLDRSGIWAP